VNQKETDRNEYIGTAQHWRKRVLWPVPLLICVNAIYLAFAEERHLIHDENRRSAAHSPQCVKTPVGYPQAREARR